MMNKEKINLQELEESYYLGTSLNEAEEDGIKHYYLEGIYAQAEIKNHNGRNYPLPILKKAIEDYKAEFIDSNRGLSELMHPKGLDLDLDRVCMRIIDLYQDPTNPANFLGKGRILDGTPKGDLTIGLLKGGTLLGVSTRGAGSVENGQVNQLFLVAIDVVFNPSAPQAFMKALKEEQEFTKQYQFSARNKFLKEWAELTESALRVTKKQNEDRKLKLLEDFITAC